ncbi:MAG: hypothetical protein ACPGVD_01610 [Flavobacteriales bacterium]
MKTLKLSTLLLAVALVFGASSCKYEEGPALSLRTKKARVAGEWEIEKTISKDGKEDTDWDGWLVTFEKDGTGKSSATYTIGGTTTTSSNTFKWEFTDSKEKIKTTDEDGEVAEVTILKLKNKEMWVKNENDTQINYKAK